MLSVVILARNEESRIRACIESVKWVDEIVVIDDNSTDRTVNIAKSCGVKVVKFYRDSLEPNFAKLRNTALEEIKGDWILYIDADERVLENLKEEIQELVKSSNTNGVWAISRRNIILGEEERYKAFWPDYVIRLFKRDHLKKWYGNVHEQPEFFGSLGKLKNSLLHLTHRDIDSMIQKSLDWANIDARLRLEAKHPPITGIRLIRILLTEIWNQGVLRQGFFNGTVGVIDSILQAISMYISFVKLWQLQKEKSLKQFYDDLDKTLINDKFKY